MKKILLTLVFFTGFSSICYSQMYVGPGSYVFVNDQFVYVTQELNLDKSGANEGNFYLRKDAQFLQGAATGTNEGEGSLSVYQEGTTNNFQYNYWCSPVGTPADGAGNNPFGITRLFRPTGVTASTVASTTTTSDGSASDSSLTISSRWIWKYIASNLYNLGGPSGWIFVGATSTVNPGLGFTMKGVSGTDTTIANPVSGTFGDDVSNNAGSKQRYDFRGKPNDGNMSIAVSAGNFTLVGNPYPSAIDLNAYLLDPVNATVINGTAYFWEQSVVNTHVLNQYQGGYGKYTVGGGYLPADIWSYNSDGTYNADTGANGTVYQRRFTPVGQGFMVMGSAAGSVTMKNTFRVFVKEAAINLSQFARTAEVANPVYDTSSAFFPEIPNVAGIDYTQVSKGYAPQLRINAVVNDTGVVHTALGFGNQYTDGVDYSADARATSDSAPYSFYFVLNESTNEYAMSLTSFDIDKRLPVGFRNNAQARFKIKVADVLYGFDNNQNVYMHDKQTGVYYDIKNNEFDMTLPAGDNRTRFEITFKNTDVVLTNPTDVAEAFTVFQNNENAMLTIYNTLNKDIMSLMMYDVTGKVVLNKTNLGKGATYEFSTAGLSDGVYVVKTKTRDNLDLSKKVIISRK